MYIYNEHFQCTFCTFIWYLHWENIHVQKADKRKGSRQQTRQQTNEKAADKRQGSRQKTRQLTKDTAADKRQGSRQKCCTLWNSQGADKRHASRQKTRQQKKLLDAVEQPRRKINVLVFHNYISSQDLAKRHNC